jgi:hypothetical protein
MICLSSGDESGDSIIWVSPPKERASVASPFLEEAPLRLGSGSMILKPGPKCSKPTRLGSGSTILKPGPKCSKPTRLGSGSTILKPGPKCSKPIQAPSPSNIQAPCVYDFAEESSDSDSDSDSESEGMPPKVEMRSRAAIRHCLRRKRGRAGPGDHVSTNAIPSVSEDPHYCRMTFMSFGHRTPLVCEMECEMKRREAAKRRLEERIERRVERRVERRLRAFRANFG